MPWRSLDIINDGPDDVFVAINQDMRYSEEAPLKTGESLNLDFSAATVDWMVLKTETGSSDTATVRIFAQL